MTRVALGLVLLLGFRSGALCASSDRREIEPDQATGTAMAVVVPDCALIHTASFMALDRDGKLTGVGDVSQQTEKLLSNLNHALQAGGSSLDRVVKLNLSVVDPGLSAKVMAVLARRFAGKAKPAVTLVVSHHPLPDALVAGDAVAMDGTASKGAGVQRMRTRELYTEGRGTHAARLPAGARIYFSGKGGRGPTAETTRKLLDDLRAGMEHVGARSEDIVQVTVFTKQMHEMPLIQDVVAQFVGTADCPPITFLDRDSGEGAMEIEMIAAGRSPEGRQGPQIEYVTPPKLKASPMFSQIARVNRGGLVYTSGLRGSAADDPEKQAQTVFSRLESLVRAGGSDMKHLAKAVYFITSREGAAGMDKVRPKAFAADRPPAASRNNLKHVGGAGGVMLIDMIGVVVEK